MPGMTTRVGRGATAPSTMHVGAPTAAPLAGAPPVAPRAALSARDGVATSVPVARGCGRKELFCLVCVEQLSRFDQCCCSALNDIEHVTLTGRSTTTRATTVTWGCVTTELHRLFRRSLMTSALLRLRLLLALALLWKRLLLDQDWDALAADAFLHGCADGEAVIVAMRHRPTTVSDALDRVQEARTSNRLC